MSFGENRLAELEPITRSRGAAAIKRSIAIYSQGLIISYALGVQGSTPVTVTVSDNLPANWDVGEVAFHPNHEPESGSAGQHTIQFSVDVSPEQFRILKVGVRPAPEKSPSELESDQSFTPPQFDSVEPAEPVDGGTESTLIGGASGDESAIEDPAALSSNGGQSAAQPSPSAQSGHGPSSPGTSDSADDGGILPSSNPIADGDPPATTETDPGIDPNEAETIADLFGGFDEDPTPATGSSSRRPSDHGATAEASTSPSPINAIDDSPANGGSVDGAQHRTPPTETPTAEAQRPANDLVPRFLDELGDLSPDHRDRLASYLTDLVEPPLPTNSTAVRVEQLESRIEEFVAYTDALGDLLDQADPAELLDHLQTELETIRAELGGLEEEVEAVGQRQDTIEDRLESMASDLEQLSDVE